MLPFPNEVQKVATSQLERFLKTLDELKKVYKEELKRRKNPIKNVPRETNKNLRSFFWFQMKTLNNLMQSC